MYSYKMNASFPIKRKIPHGDSRPIEKHKRSKAVVGIAIKIFLKNKQLQSRKSRLHFLLQRH